MGLGPRFYRAGADRDPVLELPIVKILVCEVAGCSSAAPELHPAGAGRTERGPAAGGHQKNLQARDRRKANCGARYSDSAPVTDEVDFRVIAVGKPFQYLDNGEPTNYSSSNPTRSSGRLWAWASLGWVWTPGAVLRDGLYPDEHPPTPPLPLPQR